MAHKGSTQFYNGVEGIYSLFGGQASQSGARISAALSSRCCSQIQCGVACRAFPCAPALCRGLWPQSVHMSLGSLKLSDEGCHHQHSRRPRATIYRCRGSGGDWGIHFLQRVQPFPGSGGQWKVIWAFNSKRKM